MFWTTWDKRVSEHVNVGAQEKKTTEKKKQGELEEKRKKRERKAESVREILE